MLGNKDGWLDYLDLALFRLAKLRRKQIAKNCDLEEFYEGFFTDTDEKVFNSGSDRRKVYKGQILRRIVSEHVDEGGVVIDVGCGVGDNLAAVHRVDLKFQGLEYSANNLARARAVLPSEVELMQGSAVAMPFEPGSADLMMCIEVLEHIPDQHQVLREIHRVLRPGGIFVLSVPYRRWFPAYYTQMGHIRHYTRTELQHLLSESGFAIVEYLPNYPRWHRLANYCYMFCRALTIAARIVGKNIYPHQVRLPFSRQSALDFLFDRIENVKKLEANADYSTLETSTFVSCRKIG